MQSRISFFMLVLVVFTLGTFQEGFVANQTPASPQTNPPQYFIARYVVGSGGVSGAMSSNHFHFATIGETIVGGCEGSQHFLLSGFWQPTGVHELVTSANPEAALPTEFKVFQNYPNPFNPQTKIEYDLPNKYLVTVEVFNTMGQRIRFVGSQVQGPGRAFTLWDGRNDEGQQMGSGVYVYRISAAPINNENQEAAARFQQTRKMLLVK